MLFRWSAISFLPDPSPVRRTWQLRILKHGLTPATFLVTGTLYMLLQCCFCWWNVLQSSGLLYEQLLSSLNHLQALSGSVIPQNNKAFQLYYARATHFFSKNVCHLQECITNFRKHLPCFPGCFFLFHQRKTQCRSVSKHRMPAG